MDRARLVRSQMVATGPPRALQNLPRRLRGGSTRGPSRPLFLDSGRSRLYEGRNPLSDTTDATSDVSIGRSAASASTADGAEAGATRRRRSGSGLSGMLLPE